MAKKRISSTYLVAEYLLKNKKKSYIHDMKKVTKCNNVGQRVLTLRRTFGWEIDTIFEGYIDGVPVYHYRLINPMRIPEKY